MRPLSVFPDYLVKIVIPASRAITKPVVICRCVPLQDITPLAGPIFETKNRAIFLERFFWRDFSGAALLPVQLCSHQLAVEWIHFPLIRTFVEKRFHGLFSKKKRRNLGVFLRLNRFKEENTVLAVISLPIGQLTSLDPYQDITG